MTAEATMGQRLSALWLHPGATFAVAAAAIGVTALEASTASHQRALIPTTIAIVAAKHHKSLGDGLSAKDVDEADAGISPRHKITKFLTGAVNTGDFSDADRHIAPDPEVFLNGHRMDELDLHNGDKSAIEDTFVWWRTAVPDLHWTLRDEVESRRTHTLALRLDVSGTHTGSVDGIEPTGNHFSYEVAMFVRLSGGKICQVHQTINLAEVLLALGLDRT